LTEALEDLEAARQINRDLTRALNQQGLITGRPVGLLVTA
jgi:hypothetical protein